MRTTLCRVATMLFFVCAQVVHGQDASDAFLNDDARELVRLGRLRHATVDRRIEAYSTTARQRISVGLRAGVMEKLLYRHESVTRIDWERDGPVRMELLGVRESAPIVSAQAEVPSDPSAEIMRVVFDPADPAMLLWFDGTALLHPLAEGGETRYRFEAGGTTEVRLQDGRTIRLRELRVIPRRQDPRLIRGSLWLDLDTHAVVQAFFRMARGFDTDIDGARIQASSEASRDTTSRDTTSQTGSRNRTVTLNDVPGFLKPVRADLDYIAVDYGLWENRWWLPRSIAAQGVLRVNSFRVPMTYERTYDPYTVRGDTGTAVLAPRDTTRSRCRPQMRFESSGDAARDSAWRAESIARSQREFGDSASARARQCGREIIFSATVSDSALLHSSELAPEFAASSELMSEADLEAIASQIGSIPGAPWQVRLRRPQWGLTGPGLLRYNRVEGLSIGARQSVDLGRMLIEAEARFGLADHEPRGELGLIAARDPAYVRTAAYRRLQTTSGAGNAHGTWATLGALLVGRDDEDYFDATGAELVVTPRESASQWYDIRLYVERQRAVGQHAEFSIAHALDSDQQFRPNFAADAAEQLGARLRLRGSIGLNPSKPRGAGELSVSGEAGDFRFVRPQARALVEVPVTTTSLLGIEIAAGTTEGATIPSQALWRLGGVSTLRGYGGSALVGERFWRTRTELGWGVTGARLSVFSDAAWAGPRNALDLDGALVSAGIGGSFLDGTARIDLARGLRAPKGWRLHFQLTRAW